MASSVLELLGGLFGSSSILAQIFIYSLAQQMVGAFLQPYLLEAGYDVNSANPLLEISPADLAEMVLKTIQTEPEAAAIAQKWGLTADKFHDMILNVGEPPGLEMVLQWWRRGLLPWDGGGAGTVGVLQAIQTSRLRPEWAGTINTTQWLPLSAADAVNAWVRNQVDPAFAIEQIGYNGLKPDMATILYNTNGRPPALGQLLTLYRRGIIGMSGNGPLAISVDQGIKEADLKDKWASYLEQLVPNIPGVFELRQMQLSGGLTAADTAKYYALLGVPADLTAALVTSGSGTAAVKTKELTESMIVRCYTDDIFTETEAGNALVALGYTEEDAAVLLTQADQQVILSALDAAVTKIRSLFVAGKLTPQQVTTALASLQVPATTAENLLGIWTIEQQSNVKILTAAEILDAVKYGVMDQGTATGFLEQMGYSDYDAWVLISNKLEAPQPNEPAGYPVPPAVAAPAPGTVLSAALSVTPTSGPAPLAVTADASGSQPGPNPIVLYSFDFGDGSAGVVGSAGSVSHTFAAAGTYTVAVTVTDSSAATASASAGAVAT